MVSWRSVDVVVWLLFIEVEVDGRFAFLLWYWVVLHLQVWVMDAEKKHQDDHWTTPYSTNL